MHRLMSHARALMVTAALLAVAGTTAAEPGEKQGLEAGDVIARVNGEPITRTMLEIYTEQRTRGQQQQGGEAERAALLDELISMTLLRQAAEEAGLHHRPDVAAQIENQRLNALAGAAVHEHVRTQEITDEELREEYERQAGQRDAREFNARHILVNEKDKAEDLIGELEGGARFTELAEEHSEDPGSRNVGGQLGWFSPDAMVPEFSEAVAELEPGEFTLEPVRSQFGWHVILLEDVRQASRPEFDEMRDELMGQVQNRRIENYIRQLQEDAEIEHMTE